MTRFPSLTTSVLATSLAILPMAAFAQQTAAPVQTPAPATEVAKTPATATPNHTVQAQPGDAGVKAPVTGKAVPATKPDHAKLTTPAHPAPVKAVEPNKS
jgi:hypothetical protein